MSKILIVLSAANKWTRADGSLYDSGVWAEEFVVIHEKFLQAGQDVDIATPQGVTPTIDPHSMNPSVVGSEKVEHFKRYLESVREVLARPLVLSSINILAYDAVVIPGGHGPVEDLYKDPDMGSILTTAQHANKIIASVCHGPAALLSATGPDGKWLFRGRRMTAFTDMEEQELGTADNAPWLLASRLVEVGACYEHGEKWQSHIVRDGSLISGQNPASSGPLADAVLESLA